MTFARKILLDIQKSVDCHFLSTDDLQKINEITQEEVIRKHPHPNENEDIIEINPCTEDGYVTLETQLRSKIMARDLFSDFFDHIAKKIITSFAPPLKVWMILTA